MAQLDGADEQREQAFAKLTALLRDWRVDGRKTTTAGVTSDLIRTGSLDLERLGMASNVEFWDAAEQAGVIRRERLATGHWLVLLPDETLDAVLSAIDQPRSRVAPVDARMRLRGDLWSAFVDWDRDYRRFWDRDNGRAFFCPTIQGWIPDDLFPRFIEITPALQETQLEWMTDFANSRPEESRKLLIEALDADAPRGAFRRALSATGLQSQWRQVLRDRIIEVATEWARAAEIDFASILEPIRETDSIQRASSRHDAKEPPSRPRRSSVSYETELRSRVHRAVDAMTWNDLANIPLRGEHLLGL